MAETSLHIGISVKVDRWILFFFPGKAKEVYCIRMYGLPFRSTEYQVAKWFQDVGLKLECDLL